MKYLAFLILISSSSVFAGVLYDSDRKAISHMSSQAEEMTSTLIEELDKDKTMGTAEARARVLKSRFSRLAKEAKSSNLDRVKSAFVEVQKRLDAVSVKVSQASQPALMQFQILVGTVAGMQAHLGFVEARPVFGWVPTKAEDCNTVCKAHGLVLGVSPEGAQCASGEVRPRSATGVVTPHYGCWPNCNVQGDVDGAMVKNRRYCYKPGQKQDSDTTDRTTGCYCE